MTQHTPGPWETTTGRKIILIRQIESMDEVAEITIQDGKKTWNEVDCNARLIAAAPELLETLKLAEATINRLNMAHMKGPFSPANGTLEVIAKIIAKAEGGKQ